MKMLSRTLEAKLAANACLLKIISACKDNQKRSEESCLLECYENGETMKKTVIFSLKISGNVVLEVGNIICLHPPWYMGVWDCSSHKQREACPSSGWLWWFFPRTVLKEFVTYDLPVHTYNRGKISLVKHSSELALKELKRWMKPEKVSSIITTLPSSAEIVPEPLGVVLVISFWNYPFLLSLDPVIGAVAVGNAVVLKPSEIAPSVSALFARILPNYVDSSCIKVVEGSIPETSLLLEQKWDKILYTG